MSSVPEPRPESHARGAGLAALSVGALGVVFGDVGTSPLYAIRECFNGSHALPVSPGNVLGVLSLVVWSLVIVISVKYIGFVLRADNDGEGGILALLALVRSRQRKTTGRRLLVVLGLFGAALLYGDGVITPAISVLSAVEGLTVRAPGLEPLVLPLTVVILVALFTMQSRGTARVGAVFGPVTALWFVCIATLGLASIAHTPEVFLAVDPRHAYAFFAVNRGLSFVVLGAVFLAVTGGEALYADMGHFGRRPIRLVWFGLVLPSLLLNYFGQGALLLRDPAARANPFYALVPPAFNLPMVALATAATVIASQALISGVFSLTRQAVQLGYSPRVTVVHTSAETKGQIYVPRINWLLMLACIGLVLGFRTSTGLAAAYGVGVAALNLITTTLTCTVAREHWGWPRKWVLLIAVLFLTVDLAFFSASLLKIAHGGWFPLVVALLVYTVMAVWHDGRSRLESVLRTTLPLGMFLDDIGRNPPHRVPGTAVFMTGARQGTPIVLLHHLKHNKVLHERVVLVSIATEEVPYVPDAKRIAVEDRGQGFYRVTGRYGFMEEPSVPDLLRACGPYGLAFDLMNTTFYLGRESLLTSGRSGMARWRKEIFAVLSRNARPATHFFRIPPNRVVEMGSQIEI